jgi:hypothetical protein
MIRKRITLLAFALGLGLFAVGLTAAPAVASADDLGNATFDGQMNGSSEAVANGSFVDGQLVAVTHPTTVTRNNQELTLHKGFYGLVTDGPRTYQQKTWYELDSEIGLVWVADEVLTAKSDAPLAVDSTATIRTKTTAWRNGGQLTVPEGLTGTILRGPSLYNKQRWYKLGTSIGDVWVTHPKLEVGTADSYTRGDTVTVRKRSIGWRGDEQVTLARGLEGTVQRGPSLYNSKRWYRIGTSVGDMWVTHSSIKAGRPSGLATGDTVTVSDRTSGWWADRRIAVARGYSGTITSGPSVYDDKRWFNVQTGIGTIWIPASRLENGTTAALTGGSKVRVTTNTTGWDEGDAHAIDQGTRGTTVGSPEVYDERLWIRLQTSRGSYWVPMGTLDRR